MRSKVRRKSINLINNSRWAAYVTAGAASALTAVDSADADITYSGILNQPFNDTDPSPAAVSPGAIDFFLLGAGGAYFSLLHNLLAGGNGFAGFFIGAGAGSAAFAGFSGATNTGYRYPFKLLSNLPVSAQLFVPNNGFNFATLASQAAFGQWITSGTGFVGFRFDTGAGTQYGWAQITMNAGAPLNNFTLIDYAFAEVGESIMTGQTVIPEPGSLALLAIGAAGLLAWRKQRSKTTSES